MAGITDAQLRMGRPYVTALPGAKGGGRLMSVQDVHAPAAVVWRTILDVGAYPRMVDGVCAMDVYATRETPTGGSEIFSKYTVGQKPLFALEYCVRHQYEPDTATMTFQLDYERRSQLDDMTGYWHVRELSDGWSRVFFSSDASLPHWLEWARGLLSRTAGHKNLYWVEAYSHAAVGRGKPASSWRVRHRAAD